MNKKVVILGANGQLGHAFSQILKSDKIETIGLSRTEFDADMDIPDEKLTEIYDVIHFFRIAAERERNQAGARLLSFSGSWTELNDSLFDDFLADIRRRRKAGFTHRRQDETLLD